MGPEKIMHTYIVLCTSWISQSWEFLILLRMRYRDVRRTWVTISILAVPFKTFSAFPSRGSLNSSCTPLKNAWLGCQQILPVPGTSVIWLLVFKCLSFPCINFPASLEEVCDFEWRPLRTDSFSKMGLTLLRASTEGE